MGACGDLAPLAHLTAVLIGEGEAFYQGKRMSGGEALRAAGIQPVVLEAKEGLALINGTQMMTAVGVLTLCGGGEHLQVRRHRGRAGRGGVEGHEHALSRDQPSGAAARRPGGDRPQPRSACSSDSEILASHVACGKVQDAYSLRCAPQVHGAAKDALAFVRSVLEVEVNAATDNPLVFPEEEMVISGGNFHGQPISQAMDILCHRAGRTGQHLGAPYRVHDGSQHFGPPARLPDLASAG